MPSGSVSFERTAVTFATSVRNATPPYQDIAITLTGVPGGARDSRVQIAGEAVFLAGVYFTNGTGHLRIIPEFASSLAVSVNTANITVSICIDDPGCSYGLIVGQPQTINVTCTVASSVQGDTVSPRVITASQPGDVVIRGRGFTGATSVRFGSVAASALTVVSDLEIHASYPTLAPALYPVSIDSGTIAFTGAITQVNLADYAATTLAFPSTPRNINALLVAAQYEQQ